MGLARGRVCAWLSLCWPQPRCRGKLDTMVGQARLPGLEDHQRLHYTNAVLQETQRFIRVLPLGLSHTFACAAPFSPRYPLSMGIVCKAGEHLVTEMRRHQHVCKK